MTAKLYHLKGDAIAGALEQIEKDATVVIPHVCNDLGKWGSGFVVALNKALGFAPKSAYQMWYKHGSMKGSDEAIAFAEFHNAYKVETSVTGMFDLGAVQAVRFPSKLTVMNMIGQHQVTGMDETGRPPIRYGALAKAMKHVADHTAAMKTPTQIHCPRFGSDLAGGNWDVIEEMIMEIWVDRGLQVFEYEFV